LFASFAIVVVKSYRQSDFCWSEKKKCNAMSKKREKHPKTKWWGAKSLDLLCNGKIVSCMKTFLDKNG
jgi:hypothetical protein